MTIVTGIGGLLARITIKRLAGDLIRRPQGPTHDHDEVAEQVREDQDEKLLLSQSFQVGLASAKIVDVTHLLFIL